MVNKEKNRRLKQSLILFGILALISILPLIYASDWVEDGYDLNNTNWDKVIYPFGVSSATFSDDGGFVASAVVNGSIYFVSFRSDKLYRANASNISQVYETFQTGGDVYYTLAITDGIAYLGSGDGYIYMQNASNISQTFNSYNIGSAIYGIVIKDDYVYLPADSTMYQVNKSDVSQVINSYVTGGTISSHPSVKNGYLYFASIDGLVYQLNATDLSLANSFNLGGLIYGSPAVTDEYVFIGKSGVVVQLNASNISQEITRKTGIGDMNTKPTISGNYVYFADITSLYQCDYNNISSVVDTFTAPSWNTIGYYSSSADGNYIYLATSSWSAVTGHIYFLDVTDISDIIQEIAIDSANFGWTTLTDKYLYVSGNGANLEDKMYMFNITGLPNATFPMSAILDYPTNTTYSENVTQLNYTILYADTCLYSTDNGITNHSISCSNNSISLISGYGSHTWTIYGRTDEGDESSDSVTFYVTSPTEEPEQETGFSTSGQAIYEIMDSSGAGLGLFLQFMGLALPPLLIILGLIGVIVLIGYLLANTIKESLTKFHLK